MIAKELLSSDILPLRTSDSGAFALSLMAEFHVRHLPIVSDAKLLGIVSEEDLLDHDQEEAVGSYHLSMNRPYVDEEDHIFEVMARMSEYRMTAVPVIDEQGSYVGIITQDDLLLYYARSFSFAEPGSIVVLQMMKNEYALSNISQIVESEQGIVLSTFITSEPQGSNILVTLKINRQDISSIIAALQRYDYVVKASFTEGDYYDELKDRYDMLMTYLDV